MARKKAAPAQEPTSEEVAQEIARSLLMSAEMFAPIREATNAYKNSYVNEGWSPDAAEAVAVQYHSVLCQGFLAGVSNNE